MGAKVGRANQSLGLYHLGTIPLFFPPKPHTRTPDPIILRLTIGARVGRARRRTVMSVHIPTATKADMVVSDGPASVSIGTVSSAAELLAALLLPEPPGEETRGLTERHDTSCSSCVLALSSWGFGVRGTGQARG